MGVDTRILLPYEARIQDIVDVMGQLAGLPVRLAGLPARQGLYRYVEGITVEPYTSSSLVGCLNISFLGHSVMLHLEFTDGMSRGYAKRMFKGMMPRSTPFWVAMGYALVSFFGGRLDYDDSDDSQCDYKVKTSADLMATDGEAWDLFQHRKFSVKPLTADMLEAARYHASSDMLEAAR